MDTWNDARLWPSPEELKAAGPKGIAGYRPQAKAVVHVNRQHIAQNAKDGGDRPIYTIKKTPSAKALYARELKINGPCRLVYDGEQLRCGARAWIEADYKDLEPIGGWYDYATAKVA